MSPFLSLSLTLYVLSLYIELLLFGSLSFTILFVCVLFVHPPFQSSDLLLYHLNISLSLSVFDSLTLRLFEPCILPYTPLLAHLQLTGSLHHLLPLESPAFHYIPPRTPAPRILIVPPLNFASHHLLCVRPLLPQLQQTTRLIRSAAVASRPRIGPPGLTLNAVRRADLEGKRGPGLAREDASSIAPSAPVKARRSSARLRSRLHSRHGSPGPPAPAVPLEERAELACVGKNVVAARKA